MKQINAKALLRIISIELEMEGGSPLMTRYGYQEFWVWLIQFLRCLRLNDAYEVSAVDV